MQRGSMWVYDWGVVCVTSCTVSPPTCPLAAAVVAVVVECGGKGKLMPEGAFSPEWLFGAVTVTMTCATEGQVGGVRCGISWA